MSNACRDPVAYPSFVATFGDAAKCYVRSCGLLALFTVYVFNHAAAFPSLLTAIKGSAAVQHALSTNVLLAWLQATFFDGHTAEQLGGKTLLDALLFVAFNMAAHETVYWGYGGFFIACDKIGAFAKYKLPRTKRMAMAPGLMRKTLTDVAVNHFVAQPVTLFLAYRYLIGQASMYAAPGSTVAAAAPELLPTFVDFVLALFIAELGFYLAHRMFHEVPFLYRTIHKQHHSYVGSIAFACEYAHPVEQVIANQLPVLLYAAAQPRMHQTAVFCWLFFRLLETVEAHSGYCFKGSPAERLGLTFSSHAAFHDWHHSDNRGNYGFPWTDWLGGTLNSYLLMQQGADGNAPRKVKKKQ
jgi:sterol desaturase/sphingolipid hydroxylase (fatty acid hydroxylase superfamily)